MSYSVKSMKGLPPPPEKPNYTAWYLLALVSIFLIVVLAVLGLTIIRPTADNSSLISTIVGIALLAVPTLISLIKGTENGAAIQVYHEAVNSKMDAWIKAAEEVASLQAADATRKQSDETARLLAISTIEATKLQSDKTAEAVKLQSAETARLQRVEADRIRHTQEIADAQQRPDITSTMQYNTTKLMDAIESKTDVPTLVQDVPPSDPRFIKP